MYSRCDLICWILLLMGGLTTQAADTPSMAAQTVQVLRIGADPNNLPYSNRRLEGFENKIAELVARELGATIEYTWFPQRLGFFRETVGRNGTCDLVLGVPRGFDKALTTEPYYRSSYVFVYRQDKGWKLHSFDDPLLRSLRIGVQVATGDNPPPVQALVNRQMITNLVGFTLLAGGNGESPADKMVQSVAKRELDVAIIWGPWAGYYARRQQTPLELVPVSPDNDGPYVPFTFDMCMGVRRSKRELKDQIDQILQRKRLEIRKILDEYGVPQAPARPATAMASPR